MIQGYWACNLPSCLSLTITLKDCRIAEVGLGCDERDRLPELDWQAIQNTTILLFHLERLTILCPTIDDEATAVAWIKKSGIHHKANKLLDAEKLWMSFPYPPKRIGLRLPLHEARDASDPGDPDVVLI